MRHGYEKNIRMLVYITLLLELNKCVEVCNVIQFYRMKINDWLSCNMHVKCVLIQWELCLFVTLKMTVLNPRIFSNFSLQKCTQHCYFSLYTANLCCLSRKGSLFCYNLSFPRWIKLMAALFLLSISEIGKQNDEEKVKYTLFFSNPEGSGNQ